jgi:outer membrane protein assembly factor BamD
MAYNTNAEELDLKTEQQYFLDGMYYYADRSYTSSAEQFEALSHHYPYSRFTHDALLMEIYTNFIDNEKAKIDGIAEVFYRLFPADKDTPYVMYMQAMAEYTLLKDEKRMLDKMNRSEMLFKLLMENFPETIYAESAKKNLIGLNFIKQANYIHVAEVYQSRDDLIGAMKRYTGYFEIFKNKIDNNIEEIVLCRLQDLTNMLNLREESLKYVNILRQKYPDNKCKIAIQEDL